MFLDKNATGKNLIFRKLNFSIFLKTFVISYRYPEVTITSFLSINTTVFNSSGKHSLKSNMHDCTYVQCQSKLDYIQAQSPSYAF